MKESMRLLLHQCNKGRCTSIIGNMDVLKLKINWENIIHNKICNQSEVKLQNFKMLKKMN